MCCHTPGKSVNLQSIILAPFFSAYFSTSLGVIPRSFTSLNGILALFTGADADDFIDRRDEDLSVADATGLRGLRDGAQHLVHHVVLDDDLDLHLRDEVHDIGRAAADLLLAAGAAEALN